MLEFYYQFIDKCIDISEFELLEMDTDSNYFAFSEDSIEKLIKPEMRHEYAMDNYNSYVQEVVIKNKITHNRERNDPKNRHKQNILTFFNI
jgi:hypothetical protein